MSDDASKATLTLNDDADRDYWLNVMHRRTIVDAEQIATLYGRIAWLAQPWWRRILRKRPW